MPTLETLQAAGIPVEDEIYVDFVDDDLGRLRQRLIDRSIMCNLISIHRVNDGAYHQLVSAKYPKGFGCNKPLEEQSGYVLVWAKK